MTDAPWMFDELGHAGRENLDVAHVAQYDRMEDSHADDEVALLHRFGLDERSEVVDLGAGTGQLTLAAAPHCARVVAVDVSPAMLDLLRRKVDDAGHSNVDVVRAGFLTYDHRGPAPDIVYSRFALHHLPDAWKAIALARIRAMLAPGGILRLSDVVYGFEPRDADARFDAWAARFPVEAPEGEWTRADVEEHVRDEYSTFTWLLEPMMERCGFALEDVHHTSDDLFARYVARAI